MFDICIFLVFLVIECELVGDLGFGSGDWVCVCVRASESFSVLVCYLSVLVCIGFFRMVRNSCSFKRR